MPNIKHTFSDAHKVLSLYFNRSVTVIFLCWLISGIPLLLTASTFSLWLSDIGVKNTTIGLLGWVAFPYSLKFIWAPFIDRIHIPYFSNRLGHRRSMMFVSQVIMSLSLFGLSQSDPRSGLMIPAIFAILVAFSSATLDFVIMAYQIERLDRKQYGAGEAMGIFGFRVGMLISGAGAISLATITSWSNVYVIMALITLLGPILTLMIKPSPPLMRHEFAVEEEKFYQSLREHRGYRKLWARAITVFYGAVYIPFRDFRRSQPWVMAIVIMFVAKISDNLIGSFTNIFLADVGFTKIQIASVSKIFGMATTIIGGLFAGYFISTYGVLRSLIWGIAMHAITILTFALLARLGPNLDLLYLAVGLEHLTGGVRTTSLLVLQMMLVTPMFAAAQISLMNSVSHLSRKIGGSLSGFMVDAFGWSLFFVLCSAASIISLIVLVYFLRVTVKNYQHLNIT